MRKVLTELARYIWRERKFWLVPVIVVLALVTALVILSLKSGAAAPFIYPLF